MLTRPQVQRCAVEPGLRDMMIAEKEVVLTFLPQLLSDRGIVHRLAFKRRAWLWKIFLGNQGRFSTDLDFTGIKEYEHEDVILAMIEAFDQPFYGIQFAIAEEGYYETQDGPTRLSPTDRILSASSLTSGPWRLDGIRPSPSPGAASAHNSLAFVASRAHTVSWWNTVL